MTKKIVGLVEMITIKGKKRRKKVLAKFDTGARRTSVDCELAEKMGLGPVIKNRKVSSCLGRTKRPVVSAGFIIKGKKIKTNVNLSHRRNMHFKVLIGRDIVFNNFIIDISKSHKSVRQGDLK